ncbi:MAG: helix-turn-helix domain-containing protein [Thermoanaerobaculia bacterium]
MIESAFLFGMLLAFAVPRDGEHSSISAMIAENRFLRAQLAMFVSRGEKPRCPNPHERIELAFWSMMFDWRDSLLVVTPVTLIRWQPKLVRLDWAWISKVWCRARPGGRRPLEGRLQDLIARLASENPLWSPRRIANELKEKFGIVLSPTTVRKYLRALRGPDDDGGSRARRGQRWTTFVRNHLGQTLACDFMTTTTLMFKKLYVFVLMDLGSRRIVRLAVTEHPTAAWTIQQLRDAIPSYSFPQPG